MSSHRAAAASAAFLLTGAAFAGPALAEGGKGDKGAKGGSHGRSEGHARANGASGAGAKGAAAKGGGDPAGNNGTFKVDGLPYSDGMANEPHVACGFRLKMFGFDDGQTGDITIAGHAPSGEGVVSERTGVLLSDDAAGGGPNDVDATFEYTEADLDLAGLTAHPQQGYHLKVTLSTDTPGGKKHKVFWFEPCAPAAMTTPPDALIEDRTDTTGVLGTTTTRTTVGTTGTTPGGTAPGATPDATVLGVRFTRPGALPNTGAPTDVLLALGSGLVVLGGAAVAAGRRRSVV